MKLYKKYKTLNKVRGYYKALQERCCNLQEELDAVLSSNDRMFINDLRDEQHNKELIDKLNRINKENIELKDKYINLLASVEILKK